MLVGNPLCCAHAHTHLRTQMTRKLCIVGMCSAILRNHLEDSLMTWNLWSIFSPCKVWCCFCDRSCGCCRAVYDSFPPWTKQRKCEFGSCAWVKLILGIQLHNHQTWSHRESHVFSFSHLILIIKDYLFLNIDALYILLAFSVTFLYKTKCNWQTGTVCIICLEFNWV